MAIVMSVSPVLLQNLTWKIVGILIAIMARAKLTYGQRCRPSFRTTSYTFLKCFVIFWLKCAKQRRHIGKYY